MSRKSARQSGTERSSRTLKSKRSFESYDPMRDPSMRPSPFQAYVPHPDWLRQILHLLHRAERAWPRAEPAARTHRRRSAQLAAEGCKEVTLLGQTVNSYDTNSAMVGVHA